MPQTSRLIKPEYTFIIKCVLYDIRSPKQIHQALKSNFLSFKGDYTETINKLTWLSKIRKFLYKNKPGKITQYYLNYAYWYEFIDKNYFNEIVHLTNLDYNDTLLHQKLEEYLKNDFNNPVTLLDLIHRFVIFSISQPDTLTKLELQQLKKHGQTKVKSIPKEEINWLFFQRFCDIYHSSLILYLNDKQKEEILKSDKL